MSFYYVKPESDQSPTASSILPSFGSLPSDFAHTYSDSPSYFGQPNILRSTSFSDQIWADRFTDDSMTEQFLLRPSVGSSDVTDAVSESSADISMSGTDSYILNPLLSGEEYNRLASERPWERVPVEDVNIVPPEFGDLLRDSDHTSFRLGPFKALLRFYILQAVDRVGLSRAEKEGVKTSITPRLANCDLIQYAKAMGLFPLVIRLHLEFTKFIPMTLERADLLHFSQEKRRRAKLAAAGSQTNDARYECGKLEYFPGIELKLGKERDTLIRPMVTSVFRSDREAFRSALALKGLKYGELRMWKDAQLCTALHVADSFRPGIWAKAVELHIKKMSRPPRIRKSIQKG